MHVVNFNFLLFTGMSDISTASQHTITTDLKEGIRSIHRKATELKTDLRHIRRMHQLNHENMQEFMEVTFKKITVAIIIMQDIKE